MEGGPASSMKGLRFREAHMWLEVDDIPTGPM